MGRRRKASLVASGSDHSIMRRNIEVRLQVMFPRATGDTHRYEQLAKLSGIGQETIRKFMVEDSSPRLKTVSEIAAAVGLTLPELFTAAESDEKALSTAESRTGTQI